MRFSYSLLKTFVPKLKGKPQVLEALTLHAFEAENAPGDALEVKLPPNRYSDAGSHLGLAREIGAILSCPVSFDEKRALLTPPPRSARPGAGLIVKVEEERLCPRYTALLLEGVSPRPSPKWMQAALRECGLRPINFVVDVMNYAMLEMGQPLHAFDADKLDGGRLVVRRAKAGESIVTIDGATSLSPEILVIADRVKPVAIAGVKGGKSAEIGPTTKRIIVESANFDPISVYRTSRALGLVTDASVRFAHTLAPHLAGLGLMRAARLLVESGAKPIAWFDSRTRPAPRRVLKFDVNNFNRLIGSSLGRAEAGALLARLGFRSAGPNAWEVPPWRIDIETHADLAEEVVRLYGYGRLAAHPPHVYLNPGVQDETIVFREKARGILASLGMDEVYNSSFISKTVGAGVVGDCVELENPVSEEFFYLRPSLVPNLLGSVAHNAKFLDDLRLFEVGKVMNKTPKGIGEHAKIGIVRASKGTEAFFELKGIAEELLEGLGLVEFATAPANGKGKTGRLESAGRGFLDPATLLEYRSGGTSFGYLGHPRVTPRGWKVSVAEFDLDMLLELVEEEEEYEPLPKYPSVMRDLSVMVPVAAHIGDVMQAIQALDLRVISDVDLIDEYTDPRWEDQVGVTLRIVFQREDRTLTTVEVDRLVEKITAMLDRQFNAEVR